MKKLTQSLSLALALGVAFIPSVYSAEDKSAETSIASQSSLININTATVEQLESLPGIGAKKARAIVDYRTENGRFLSIDELSNVKGIGKKMVSKLSDKISAG